MNRSAYLCPHFELPNDVLLMDAHESHFCGQVHGEVPAVRYTDAATQFPAGALLSALLCEPGVTLARKRHVPLERTLQLVYWVRREKAGNHYLSVWE